MSSEIGSKVSASIKGLSEKEVEELYRVSSSRLTESRSLKSGLPVAFTK